MRDAPRNARRLFWILLVAGIALIALNIKVQGAAAARISPTGHTHLVSGDGTRTREQPLVNRSQMPVPTANILVYHFPTAPSDPCGGGGACSNYNAMYFDIPTRSKHSVYHELGHHFDYKVMDDTARVEFSTVIGDPRPWHAFPNSPHEKFAEAYSLCAEFGYNKPAQYITNQYAFLGYDLRLSYTQYRRACSSIRRAALRHPQGPR